MPETGNKLIVGKILEPKFLLVTVKGRTFLTRSWSSWMGIKSGNFNKENKI